MGGNPNIQNLQEGCEELEQCIRDFVEMAKEEALENAKEEFENEVIS